ncbi:MAG: FtsX-like permease family protein [Nitrososphaerales archaeon]
MVSKTRVFAKSLGLQGNRNIFLLANISLVSLSSTLILLMASTSTQIAFSVFTTAMIALMILYTMNDVIRGSAKNVKIFKEMGARKTSLVKSFTLAFFKPAFIGGLAGFGAGLLISIFLRMTNDLALPGIPLAINILQYTYVVIFASLGAAVFIGVNREWNDNI